MKKLLLASLIGSALGAFAQDYQPIKKNEVYYFSNGKTEDLYPIQVDSAIQDGRDSVFFMYKQLRQINETGCGYTSLGDSWLGKYIALYKSGYVRFSNGNGNTFGIDTKARLGESATAYQGVQWKALATVTAWTKETFLGLSDSVKTYTISVVKTNGKDTTHVYDGYELKLSKHHGIIKTIEFYAWDYGQQTASQLELVGIQGLRLGRTMSTGKQIYNYKVGDVFHIEEYISTGSPTSMEFKKKNIQLTVLSKNTASDSYSYTLRRFQTIETEASVQYSEDTIVENHLFSMLNQPYGQLTQDFAKVESDYSLEFKKQGRTLVGPLYTGTPNCLNELVFGNGPAVLQYYDGLGGPYSDERPEVWNHYYRRLVYYKKGTEEWGKPLSVSKNNAYLASQITVSPNPAQDFVQFDLGTIGQSVTIELRDATGQLLWSKNTSGNCRAEVSDFQKGLYFYSISNGSAKTSGKIILQ